MHYCTFAIGSKKDLTGDVGMYEMVLLQNHVEIIAGWILREHDVRIATTPGLEMIQAKCNLEM